ncbi:hypothetical protein VF14_20210 [Nostoc linckia z18]|uniref:Uncharacterized protein n=2 Tax=Nostoc linckia TaxID=92942 RepID=A0A9Q6ELV7_NOSLI|nr:hypothetical protein [Nostoc linckia]PHJ77689.1 hypothetical protein VF03_03310 [Nostoc linckia z2]PHJ98377.1 hypothetical protein VF04_09530 [Nostoc linckia z7]PHK42060.1 hypothetical protein VF12_04175 [Nostoc linckia z15]PHK46484.1 hypothetical protein VF13_10415 [Nostoc linckia z16]PHJ66247.1 hypothetical protein VF02_08320 [Nostoc linckia z1]
MRDKGAVKIMKFQPVFSSATLPNTIDFLQKSGKGGKGLLFSLSPVGELVEPLTFSLFPK